MRMSVSWDCPAFMVPSPVDLCIYTVLYRIGLYERRGLLSSQLILSLRVAGCDLKFNYILSPQLAKFFTLRRPKRSSCTT